MGAHAKLKAENRALRARMKRIEAMLAGILSSELEAGHAGLDRVLASPKHLRIATGMSPKMFDFLLAQFTKYLLNGRHGPLFRENKKRTRDPGRRRKLDTRHVLLMYLIWARSRMDQQDLARYYGVDQSTICRYLGIARDVLKHNQLNPLAISRMLKGTRTKRHLSMWVPDDIMVVDCTNFVIRRPADADKRRDVYSGKRKNFSYMVMVLVNRQGLLLGLSRAVGGRNHDMAILRKYFPNLGKWSKSMLDPATRAAIRMVIYGDSRYQGMVDVFPGADVFIPYKRPKGGSLTAAQRRHNRSVSRIRNIVERSIGRLKRFGRLVVPYCGTEGEFDEDLQIMSGLDNFMELHKRKHLMKGERKKHTELLLDRMLA